MQPIQGLEYRIFKRPDMVSGDFGVGSSIPIFCAQEWILRIKRMLTPIFFFSFWWTTVLAQSVPFDASLKGVDDPQVENKPSSSTRSDSSSQTKAQKDPASMSLSSTSSSNDAAKGKQSKRILWIIPNYRAVSADTQLPPLSLKSEFWLATQDSFDYSSFILAAILAGYSQARNSTPEFRQGAAGYGRYYWHSFADQAVGNYFTEAIVPALTHEDPRYYTLGHGNFFHRTGYALSRLLVTRTDSGGTTFNFSEIVGNGAGAGVSDLYYPAAERTWTKTGQKWLIQVGLDGVFNVLKEFWPDINQKVFHERY